MCLRDVWGFFSRVKAQLGQKTVNDFRTIIALLSLVVASFRLAGQQIGDQFFFLGP